MPGFKITMEKPDWVEVSVFTFPDQKERAPAHRPGRIIKPKPMREKPEIKRIERLLPADKALTGIEIREAEPLVPDFVEIKYDTPVRKEVFEKLVPGKIDRKGITDEDDQKEDGIITGPVARRKLIRKVIPQYPAWAKEKGIEGNVSLKFWVSPAGTVSEVELLLTSGFPDFDARAIRALRSYLFAPLAKEKEQKTQWGTITIRYSLK